MAGSGTDFIPNPFGSNTELLKGEKKKEYLEKIGIKDPTVIPTEGLTDEELLAGMSDTSTEGGGYGKKRMGVESRGQMNLTRSRGSSILTS